MNRIGQDVIIQYDIKGRILHYRGPIISEDTHFITVNDFKGIISLNKDRIISIEVR